MGSTYRFPVLERTTGEIHTSLRSTAVPPTVAREFLSLLDESDLVKFSKFKPSVSDAYQTLALAFTIVEETKPVFIESEPPSMNGKQDLLEPKTILTSSSNTGVFGNGKYRQSEVKA